MPTPVAVLGGGSFGTCLAVLASREHDVVLWARDAQVVDGVNREHRNPRYLEDVALPERLRASNDLGKVLADAELVICAVPSHGVREVMTLAGQHLSREAVLVSTEIGRAHV